MQEKANIGHIVVHLLHESSHLSAAQIFQPATLLLMEAGADSIARPLQALQLSGTEIIGA